MSGTANLVPLPRHGGDAPESATPNSPPPAFHRVLRIALAMKGGVSLAVWIGGAVAELDLLRRIRIFEVDGAPAAFLIANVPGSDDPEHVRRAHEHVVARAGRYGDLLIARGYDSVQFDLLAGASAGGLNAVLYGVAQRRGATFDGVIGTWVRAGAIWELLRPTRSLSGYTSVLKGDGYFTGRVRTAINELYDEGTERWTEHQAAQVAVELSATMIDDDIRPEWDFQRGRAHFRFVGNGDDPDEPVGVDAFTEREAETLTGDESRWIPREPRSHSSDRLALAARTTSSFPGAFEPSRIWSHAATRPLAPGGDPRVDMSFAFSHHRGGGTVGNPGTGTDLVRPFRVIDGGVADNVPVDRALRAIRDVPSLDYGDRAILYLEPDPPRPSVTIPATPTSPPPLPDEVDVHSTRLFDVVRTTLGMRGVRESGDSEVDEVERFRRELYQWQGRKESFAALADGYVRTAAQVAYERYRATSDLDFLAKVLEDPPIWQLGAAFSTRSELSPIPRRILASLDREFIRKYQETGLDAEETASLLTGSQALIGATKSAVAWVRDLEDLAFSASRMQQLVDDPRHAATRQSLYDTMREAKAVRDAHIRSLLTTPGSTSSAKTIVLEWLKSEHDDADRVEASWKVLRGCVTDLVGLGALVSDLEGFGDIPWPRGAVAIDRFRDTNPDAPVFGAADLAPFTAALGIPDPVKAVRFETINANEKVIQLPGSERFPGLVEEQLAQTASGWMKLPAVAFERVLVLPDEPPRLLADAKLAGSALAHFGAFFSAKWRTNDWWWGRLDAGAGLVRFLGSLKPMPPRPGDDGSSALDLAILATAVQDEVLLEATQRPEASPFPDTAAPSTAVEAGKALTAGAHSLRNLSWGYLVSVASHASRVALRAASQGRGFVVSAVMNVFLPPILVNVPFVVAPLRAVVAALIVATGIGIVSDPSDRPSNGAGLSSEVWITIVVVVAIMVGLLIYGWVDWVLVSTRRRRITERPYFSDYVGTRGDRAGRDSAGLLIAAAIAFAGAIAVIVYDHALLPRFWTLALLGLGLALYARARARAFDSPVVWMGTLVAWVVLIALGMVALLFTPPLGQLYKSAFGLHPDQNGTAIDNPFAPATVVGIVGLLLSLIMTFGWLCGRRSSAPRVVLSVIIWLGVAVAVGAVAFGAIWLVSQTFTGTFLIAAPAAAGLLAWLLGAHVLWWLGSLLSPASLGEGADQPRFTGDIR